MTERSTLAPGTLLYLHRRARGTVHETSVLDELENFRAMYGLTKTDFSALLGLGRTHYSTILAGGRKLPLSAIKRAFALGVSPGILLQPEPSHDVFR